MERERRGKSQRRDKQLVIKRQTLTRARTARRAYTQRGKADKASSTIDMWGLATMDEG